MGQGLVLTASSSWCEDTHWWPDCYAWFDATSSASSVCEQDGYVQIEIEIEKGNNNNNEEKKNELKKKRHAEHRERTEQSMQLCTHSVIEWGAASGINAAKGKGYWTQDAGQRNEGVECLVREKGKDENPPTYCFRRHIMGQILFALTLCVIFRMPSSQI